MIADEGFLAFFVTPFEQTHREIFVGMIVSLGAIRLLPNA